MEIYLVMEQDYEGVGWGVSRVTSAFTRAEDAITYVKARTESYRYWVDYLVLNTRLPFDTPVLPVEVDL